MSKNLEEFKKMIKFPNKMFNTNQLIILGNLIPVLEDFEKRLKAIEAELGIYTEEEIKKIKVGGTDPS